MAIEQVARCLTETGYKRLVLRTDGEHALVAFMRAVAQRWGGEVVPQQSPTSDPQANGAAEMAMGLMKGHIRSMKDALDSRIGAALPDNHPLLT